MPGSVDTAEFCRTSPSQMPRMGLPLPVPSVAERLSAARGSTAAVSLEGWRGAGSCTPSLPSAHAFPSRFQRGPFCTSTDAARATRP